MWKNPGVIVLGSSFFFEHLDMFVHRVYVFACAMFAGLATDTSMDGTEDVFEFMHELCHLLQNSKVAEKLACTISCCVL